MHLKPHSVGCPTAKTSVEGQTLLTTAQSKRPQRQDRQVVPKPTLLDSQSAHLFGKFHVPLPQNKCHPIAFDDRIRGAPLVWGNSPAGSSSAKTLDLQSETSIVWQIFYQELFRPFAYLQLHRRLRFRHMLVFS
jgi:hypothetical protein